MEGTGGSEASGEPQLANAGRRLSCSLVDGEQALAVAAAAACVRCLASGVDQSAAVGAVAAPSENVRIGLLGRPLDHAGLFSHSPNASADAQSCAMASQSRPAQHAAEQHAAVVGA